MEAGWTVIMPFKPAGSRKTRLAARLTPAARDALSEALFWRTFATLSAVPVVAEIVLLSAETMPGWGGRWLRDEAQGLNAELIRAQKTLDASRIIVIHADLPFVAAEDVAALLAGADSGCAIAPDRHGSGTNAIALNEFAGFTFSFGKSSFAKHLAIAKDRARVVTRPGLWFDIDTPEDLDLAYGMGLKV